MRQSASFRASPRTRNFREYPVELFRADLYTLLSSDHSVVEGRRLRQAADELLQQLMRAQSIAGGWYASYRMSWLPVYARRKAGVTADAATADPNPPPPGPTRPPNPTLPPATSTSPSRLSESTAWASSSASGRAVSATSRRVLARRSRNDPSKGPCLRSGS